MMIMDTHNDNVPASDMLPDPSMLWMPEYSADNMLNSLESSVPLPALADWALPTPLEKVEPANGDGSGHRITGGTSGAAAVSTAILEEQQQPTSGGGTPPSGSYSRAACGALGVAGRGAFEDEMPSFSDESERRPLSPQQLKHLGLPPLPLVSPMSVQRAQPTPHVPAEPGAARFLYSSGTVGWMEEGHDEYQPTDPENLSGAVQSAVEYLLEDTAPDEATDGVAHLLRDLDIASRP